MWNVECGVWSENSTVIQYSYTKSLELITYLTPHSTLLTPQYSSLHIPRQRDILEQDIPLHFQIVLPLTNGFHNQW